MSVEEDPKEVARLERKRPEVEKSLRQFLKMESGAFTRPSYRANYDAAFNGSQKLPSPRKCMCDCSYEAKTVAEQEHHERVTGHNIWMQEVRENETGEQFNKRDDFYDRQVEYAADLMRKLK